MITCSYLCVCGLRGERHSREKSRVSSTACHVSLEPAVWPPADPLCLCLLGFARTLAHLCLPKKKKTVNEKCRLIAFLQRWALRSQDFAIFHTEYIGFEIPDQIRMLSSGFYILIGPDSIRNQCENFKSVRILIVTKTITSEQKWIVTIEFCKNLLVVAQIVVKIL